MLLRACLLTTVASLETFAGVPPAGEQERMVEWTFESKKVYADPFNDVEVDVVFSKDGRSWRVPAFWRGGQRWTVRFAPPLPGDYSYSLQSTDSSNSDLNRRIGRVSIGPYTGPNDLLRHGMLRVSANKRYFEHADGTPFFWLGDTWWTGLSDRLSWEGFQKLASDRRDKGFTLVQVAGGLVPSNEELPPADPGFCNEGGCVWEDAFKRINPNYFDYADRRIQCLLENGLVPAIVGGWRQALSQMGSTKMKQHWRYLIARYGAYPVFWIAGGELIDPPPEVVSRISQPVRSYVTPGWTDVVKYIRAVDPYHHPLTAHEFPLPWDFPVQDELLTDFDMFQPSAYGWASIAANVAQMNLHYSRTSVTKPLVQGEMGYEKHREAHFEDFQRMAFWLSILNGAAGHTYGADGVFEAYTGDKPLHRLRWSFLSWEEGMRLPGSYQVGLSAKLLKQYRWWQFVPHPEWITPRGTTLLEPRQEINGFFDPGSDSFPMDLFDSDDPYDSAVLFESRWPSGEWKARQGDFRRPYAAGIPGEVRFIYMPNSGMAQATPPTVLGLELGVRYSAYLWEPSLGTRIDLGTVERPAPNEKIFEDDFSKERSRVWTISGTAAFTQGVLSARGETLATLNHVNETDVVVMVRAQSNAQAALVLRYRDAGNNVIAAYSPEGKSLYLLERKDGRESRVLGKTPVHSIGAEFKLTAEVRGTKGAASITDGERTYTTPIVNVGTAIAGTAGLLHQGSGLAQRFDQFEIRRSPVLVEDNLQQRQLYDASGVRRGTLVGEGGLDWIPDWSWSRFGREKHILLDAYRPERLPTPGDWILVLENTQNRVRAQEKAGR